MDGSELVGSDGATLVNGLTNHIDNSAESFGADGHQNGGTGVVDGLSTDKTFSGVQSNSSDVVTTQVLSDLEHESVLHTLDFKSVENRRESTLELHVDDGTNNLRNLSLCDPCAEATYTRHWLTLWLSVVVVSSCLRDAKSFESMLE